MILLKNEMFGNEFFINTVRKINEDITLKAKDAYWFNKLSQILQLRLIDYENMRTAMMEKHGSPLPNEPGKFIINSTQVEEFTMEMKEINEKIIEIDINKIHFPEDVGLTPQQMGVLEDLFDFSNLE